MKSTKWQKPVGDCGGISKLVENAVRIRTHFSYREYFDVVLHAYREVGTSLECAIEIRWYSFHTESSKIKKVYYKTEFKTWCC